MAFLGGAYADLSINNLIGPWGVTYDNNRIETSNPASCGNSGCFNVTNFANHPAAGTATTFYANNNASVVVSQGAIVLAQTTAAKWRSISGMTTQQPGDPNGPFAMMAVAQVGRGRAFISGSDAFVDVVVACGCNDNISLLLLAMDWPIAALNPLPTVSASKSTISAVVNGASFGAAISPGSWATITGKNLADTAATGQVWSAGDFNGNLLPTAIQGTSVWINGRQASVEFISPGQVNVQAPDDLYTGAVSVQIISPFGVAAGTANLQLGAPRQSSRECRKHELRGGRGSRRAPDRTAGPGSGRAARPSRRDLIDLRYGIRRHGASSTSGSIDHRRAIGEHGDGIHLRAISYG